MLPWRGDVLICVWFFVVFFGGGEEGFLLLYLYFNLVFGDSVP